MAKRKSSKKKNNSNVWWITSIVLVAFVAVGYVWYRNMKIDRAKFVHYPAFGIPLPSNFEIHGIDVSKYQSFIDWPSVRKMKVKEVKIGFAFIKATEGLGNVDRQFRRNWTKAADAKMTRGAYHFFLPTKSGKAQAQNYISTVKLKPGDLPPVLDIEQLYGVKPEKMRKEIRDWLQLVEDHYGVKPIIYTYVNFYSRFLTGEFDEYPLWVAHYLERDKPRITRQWLFWQHSEMGRVNGIVSPVDFNVFNGDSSDFNDLLMK
jgi:lysozyme